MAEARVGPFGLTGCPSRRSEATADDDATQQPLAAVIRQAVSLLAGRHTPQAPAPSWRSLSVLGWIFLALAALVGLSGVSYARQVPSLSAVLLGLTWMVATALPAALLHRVPGAWRSQRLLLTGLAAGSIVIVLDQAFLQLTLFAPGPGQGAGAAIRSVRWLAPAVLGVTGALLVALGLARLRWRPASRRVRWLLPVLMLATFGAAAASLLPVVVHPAPLSPADLLGTAVILGGAPISGYALWVPLAAWIDREAPTRFWTLLGLAALAGLPHLATSVAQDVALATGSLGLAVQLGTVGAAFGPITSTLMLIAYARFTPAVPEARRPLGPPDAPDETAEPVPTTPFATVRIARRRLRDR